MTSRADLPRVFAALQVLGTEGAAHGVDGRSKIALAWDRTAGWEYGPRKPPPQWDTVDHEPTTSSGEPAPPSDRDEEERQRHRASQHHRELVDTIAVIDKATQRMFRLIDLAVPPNPAEVKNRRTGDYDDWTPTQVQAAGWCVPCWTADHTFTPIPVDAKGFKRWRDCCGFCGSFRATHGVWPPTELLELHHAGRNLSQKAVEEALTKTRTPKGKRKKKRAVA